MQPSCAFSRLARAAKKRTREAGHLQALDVGDLVDYWRQQQNKEDSGWIGPARVVDVENVRSEGTLTVKYMNRHILCRTLDVRPHLALLAFMCTLFSSGDTSDTMNKVLSYL